MTTGILIRRNILALRKLGSPYVGFFIKIAIQSQARSGPQFSQLV